MLLNETGNMILNNTNLKNLYIKQIKSYQKAIPKTLITMHRT